MNFDIRKMWNPESGSIKGLIHAILGACPVRPLKCGSNRMFCEAEALFQVISEHAEKGGPLDGTQCCLNDIPFPFEKSVAIA